MESILDVSTVNDIQEAVNNLVEKIEDLQATYEGAVVEAYSIGCEDGKKERQIETNVYVTIKRDAKVGDKILITNPDLVNAGEKGEMFTVIDAYEGFVDVEEIRVVNGEWAFCAHEYEVITEPEQAPVVKELTPNQQRAELIERVREFVEKYKDKRLGHEEKHQIGNMTARNNYYETEFVVKGNRVTALVYWLAYGEHRIGNPRHVGRADCMPGEVFNEHIRKAIALARALEINVPEEFLNAVQPTEIVKGMVAAPKKLCSVDANRRVPLTVTKVKGVQIWRGGKGLSEQWSYPSRLKITNDTNAVYSEVTHQ